MESFKGVFSVVVAAKDVEGKAAETNKREKRARRVVIPVLSLYIDCSLSCFPVPVRLPLQQGIPV